MAALSRRSLFALPVALPALVASVAAEPLARTFTFARPAAVDLRPLALGDCFISDESAGPFIWNNEWIDCGRIDFGEEKEWRLVDIATECSPSEADPPDVADDRAMAWEG